ncbi:MAG: pyridoxal-dependent decarboxylase [Anaerolineaceae bacterium]|nr:pyridoxal-dependent decarboxylase [Anaerolineaceae bacterium]
MGPITDISPNIKNNFQIDLEALKAAILQDRADDYLPFCIIGAAGTTNTGASDDLNALANICTQEDLWFHIDGAFGAWATLTPDARSQVAGMERCDSLAFDLHKWMYMPYEIGCVLVRHAEERRKAFSLAGFFNHMQVFLSHLSPYTCTTPTTFFELIFPQCYLLPSLNISLSAYKARR